MSPKSLSRIPIIFTILLVWESCDPGHNGKSYIVNHSTYTLQLKLKSSHNLSNSDDSIFLIPPNTSLEFFKFGGLGAGKDYECCTCEFDRLTLQPTDTSKSMTKIITEKTNWEISNPNKRNYNNKEIHCEFSVDQSDIK